MAAVEESNQQLAPARLVVSRAGFDRSGDWTMVTVTFEDDAGHSGASTLLVHRGGDGQWRNERRIFGAVYNRDYVDPR